MRILTCNIRYFGAPDGDNGWAHRSLRCAEVIRSRNPDVICFQEMWAAQFAPEDGCTFSPSSDARPVPHG
jgi:endonuclease/exonuclease/phosphatase family metal-dependent hydrolase